MRRIKFWAQEKFYQNISYSKLLKECEIGMSTVLIKAKILKKYKFPLLNTQEDFGLWLKPLEYITSFKI